MKTPTKSLLFTALLSASLLSAETVTVLMDFGYDLTWRGISVPTPDVNGNTWNSMGPGNYFPDLLDKTGAPTTVDWGPDTTTMNTDSYNGPAGATDAGITQDMLDTLDIDKAALGDLGAPEAAIDYIVGKLGTGEGRFQIQGLDPQTPYTLKFYGAHKYMNIATDGLTRVNVYDDPGYSNLVGTVDMPVGGIGAEHNRDQVGVIANISPAVDLGIFYVEFGDTITGLDGYLNCMSVTFEQTVQDTWAGYPKLPTGDVDTSPWIGWLNVSFGDYVWSYNLNKWIYLPEGFVAPSGAWMYIPNF